jgi:hypothetical protein
LKNFNHLFERHELIINCKQRNTNLCQWRPTGNIKATTGDNVCVSLVCKACDARTTVFLDHTQYKNHEKLLLKEIENV